MDKLIPTTEERIMEAAKKVFHCKGFDGARMQEIADEAGVNKSLVHYYFRNKDNLFNAVFEDAFGKLLAKLNEIFLSDIPIATKIETFVTYYITFLSRNSYLPLFILNCLSEKPERIKSIMTRKQLSPDLMLARIREQVRSELTGYYEDIDATIHDMIHDPRTPVKKNDIAVYWYGR